MFNHILIAKSILGMTAEWRKRVLITHPTDQRNAVAAELLERLAAEPTGSVLADVASKLEGYSDTELSRQAQLVAKLVGFRFFPGTLTSFIDEVIHRIDQSRAEWESTFHAKTGGAR
jgi:hypothetical protein